MEFKVLDYLVDYGNQRIMDFNKCDDVGIHFCPDGRVHYLLSEAMLFELLKAANDAQVFKNWRKRGLHYE